MSASPDADLPYPHETYRIWDERGNLLYIGMGRRAHDRVVTHCEPHLSRVQASALMSGLMDRWHAEKHPTRAAARDAEREAIRNEHPLFNKHHNKGWQLMRDEYFMALWDGEIGELHRAHCCYVAPMPTEITEPLPLIERDRDAERQRIAEYVEKYDLRADKPHPFNRAMTADEMRAVLDRMFGAVA